MLMVAFGCKRPAFDAGWLAALHRPNVMLNGKGIREITVDSIVDKEGNANQVDIIIYATGSDVGRLYGEGRLELKSYWESIGGPQSYLGVAVPNVCRLSTLLRSGPTADR